MDSISRDKLEKRRDGIGRWLDDQAPYVPHDQKHLDSDTAERAYWHYGYQAALSDVLKILEQTPSQK